MAGGEGTRLRPLTSNQPKPMVPIVGKPCMEHILELLQRARLRRGDRDARVHAAGDPQLLRRRRGARASRSSTRSRNRRSARPARSASRATQLDEPFLVISGDALCDVDLTELVRTHKREGRRGHDRAQVGRQPARVRDRRHRRGRADRALPREAVLGPGLLGHDQHRHLRARAGGACGTSRPTGRTTSRRSCSRCCSRWAGRSTATSSTATGRTSATSTSSGRRTSTRSTSACSLNIPGIRLRGNIWLGEGVEVDDLAAIEGPAFVGNYCRIAPEASVGAYSVLSASVTLLERARTRALRGRRRRRTSAAARASKARSSAATATSARTRTCTRAPRSATR